MFFILKSMFLQLWFWLQRMCQNDAYVMEWTWNSLTDSLRDPSLSTDSFRRQLKIFFLN